MGNFLQVDKDYYDDKNLKPIDMLVLSQIKEFNRNGCECYMTNKQFAEIFHVSEKTVANTIDRLDTLGYVIRKTSFINGNGRANRQRVLSVNNKNKNVRANITHTKDDADVNNTHTSSNGNVKSSDDSVKNDSCQCKDCTIKDKEEENKNINNSKKKNNNSPDGSFINSFNFKKGYSHVTDYLGIKCSEQEFMDACSKYDNVDYNNIIWFNNLYKDGMNIFEFVDAIKGYLS